METYYAVEINQPITFECAIKAGRLIEYYLDFFRWENDGSQLDPDDSRFSISFINFSLTINNAQLSDESMAYQCRVTVDNPFTSRVDDWPKQSELITLGVYGKLHEVATI